MDDSLSSSSSLRRRRRSTSRTHRESSNASQRRTREYVQPQSEEEDEWQVGSAEPVQEEPSAQGVHLKLTWGAKHVPRKIKFRKFLDVWILRFKLGFDYDVSTDILSPVGSCKEKITGGSLRVDAGRKKLEYCKSFDLGNATCFSIRGSCNYTVLAGDALRPRLFFMIEGARQGMWARTNREGFDIRSKVPLLPVLSAEICGNVKLPLPASEYSQEAQDQRLVIGSGDLHLHIAELNAYLYV